MSQLWAVKYGTEIRVSPDRALLGRVCADILAKKNFLGGQLTLIEPASEEILQIMKKDGCLIIRVFEGDI